ncbi:SOS response-associated peptidase [uncultured Sphingomonas sp.]|uniref:SOS response-associated peptidase n=1 Tax=uncultured Sphingomonas sp. TaxID=158754 RepID=UPI0037495ABF
MCNRYRMTEAQIALAARYGVEAPFPPDYTIPPPELFPKRMAWVVRHEEGERALDVMSWGWPRTVPGVRGPRETRVTNVRNLDSPMWRNALSKPAQRCLVPVTSFSEHGPGEKGNLPLYWFDVPSQPIFSFAGIWRPAVDGAVFAFLTCEPNSVVAPIHPKAMPLILHEEDEGRWLCGELDDLVAPFPAQLMTVSPPEYARPIRTLI